MCSISLVACRVCWWSVSTDDGGGGCFRAVLHVFAVCVGKIGSFIVCVIVSFLLLLLE